jgi:hypothetical protein
MIGRRHPSAHEAWLAPAPEEGVVPASHRCTSSRSYLFRG